jgi:hypothetical protein
MLPSDTYLMSFIRSLIILGTSLFLAFSQDAAIAAEWQELDNGSTRIKSEAPEKLDSEPTVQIPEGHYDPGQGTIDSAFGIEFGAVIPEAQIERSDGWHEPARLPAKPKYVGLVTPFKMESLELRPPVQPPQLAQQNTRYTAWVDFDNKPIAIETNTFNNAKEVIEIIARKYGEPDEVDGGHLIYRRESRALHIYQLANDKAFLRYEDQKTLEPYMYERNLSLMRKYREGQTERLTPIEKEVIQLANQLETFRQDHGEAFGLPFGKRIGFRATPDEFVPFDAPRPLSTFEHGDYSIMVSPDLMPIAVRYQVTGDEAFLALTKKELELAMELAFAGFLKQTPHHTVLTFKQQAYTLLIRKGKFQFTVHERKENADKNEREKLARLAIAEAKRERERLAELKRQQDAIAARQKQIEEEKAF